jgi:hypothetical protein
LGAHPNFWGCNVPSNSSFGGTKKINCIFSTQGRAFCILYSSCHRHWIVPLVILVSSTRMYNLHSVISTHLYFKRRAPWSMLFLAHLAIGQVSFCHG